MAAIHDRLVDAIAQFVAGLALVGEAGVVGDVGSNVYKQLLPEALNVAFPCVLVTTEDCVDEEGESTFAADWVTHPVKVLILDSVQPNLQERRRVYQRWRHDVSRGLRGLVDPAFVTVPECFDVRLRNLADDVGRGRSPFFQAGFFALCKTEEARQPGHA